MSVKMVLDLLNHLGFIIKPEKCTLTPSTKFTYLGCVWDTVLWRVGVKEKREIAIRKAASDILESESVSVRKFARLLGKIRSTEGFLPLARARSRAMGFDSRQYAKHRWIMQTSSSRLTRPVMSSNTGQLFLREVHVLFLLLICKCILLIQMHHQSITDGIGNNNYFQTNLPENGKTCISTSKSSTL